MADEENVLVSVDIPAIDRARQAIAQASKEEDVTAAVLRSVPLLALLTAVDYAQIRQELVSTLRRKVNLKHLDKAIAEEKKKAPKPKPVDASELQLQYSGLPYEFTEHGIVWWRPNNQGARSANLVANFNARIIADTVLDDGIGCSRAYKIEAEIRNRRMVFQVPAAQFGTMNWPDEFIGANANIYPGFREQCRSAIKTLSGETVEAHIFRHLGWRQVNGEYVYLHTGGAIGSKGEINLEVEVNHCLRNFRLPAPPEGEALKKSIRSSMGMLDVAPDRVMMPLFASVWRAVLGPSEFVIWLAGQSGAGKSAIAALAQQHFGADMTGRPRKPLPCSWMSSANFLEAVGFEAKEAALVFDDWVPKGSQGDVARLHRDTERIIRSAGNQQGRGRMNADVTLRNAKWARGLIITTAEDVPTIQSILGRLIVIEMTLKDVKFGDVLLARQLAAERGDYAAAMAGFVRWVAPRYNELQKMLDADIAEFRRTANSDTHRRTPDNVASLAAGMKSWLAFALESGAISEAESTELWERCAKALLQVSKSQESTHGDTDPAASFCELLISVINSGRAHIATVDGEVPPNPSSWGWGKDEQQRWTGRGERIGWVDGDDLYLNPHVAHAAVQKLGRETGNYLALSVGTINRRLKQRGFLKSIDVASETTTIRRVIEQRKQRVLHLSVDVVSTNFLPGISSIGEFSTTSTGSPTGEEVKMPGFIAGFQAIKENSAPRPASVSVSKQTAAATNAGNSGFLHTREETPQTPERSLSSHSAEMPGSDASSPTQNPASTISKPGIWQDRRAKTPMQEARERLAKLDAEDEKVTTK